MPGRAKKSRKPARNQPASRTRNPKPTPQTTAQRLARLCPVRPRLAIILGSGFQAAASALESTRQIDYSKLPGFRTPAVTGHQGTIIAGRLNNTPLLLLSGRSHYYEGISMEAITFPIRVLAAFGITDLLLTNAAGGIAPRLKPGSFMLIRDHINFMGANPLQGLMTPGQTPFVDLSETYDASLRALLRQAARQSRIPLTQGVYLAVSGPSYETPSEIRAFARLGADAVGMSTVPEAIVARHCGLRVAGISCITNPAAGLKSGLLSHKEVLSQGEKAAGRAQRLLCSLATLYGKQKPF